MTSPSTHERSPRLISGCTDRSRTPLSPTPVLAAGRWTPPALLSVVSRVAGWLARRGNPCAVALGGGGSDAPSGAATGSSKPGAPDAAPSAASDQDLAAPPRLRLLYAEDDVTSAQVMSSLLQIQGIDSAIAINGRDAVDMHVETEFDMILMDLRMPKLDGIAAAREIRAHEAAHLRPRIPIVAISASDSRELRQACRDAGMDGFLSKPVRLEQLRLLIERLAPRPGTAGSA